MDTCVFCKIRAGELPASWIHRDDDVMAIMDIQPVNDGHTLLLSTAHAPNIANLDDGTTAHLFTQWPAESQERSTRPSDAMASTGSSPMERPRARKYSTSISTSYHATTKTASAFDSPTTTANSPHAKPSTAPPLAIRDAVER